MTAATTNCVICFKTADFFGGHVHKGNEKVIAGFCSEHFTPGSTLTIDGCKGCYGRWYEQMGLDLTFMQTGYIEVPIKQKKQ